MGPHARHKVTAIAAAIVASVLFATAASAAITPTDIGVLEGYAHSTAIAANAAGQIIGVCYNEDEEIDGRAFLWLPEPAYGLTAGMHDLGVPSGMVTSSAVDINGQGQIIGECRDAQGARHGLLWLPEAAYGLEAGLNVIGGLPDEVETFLYAINDAGQIAGQSEVDVGEEWPRGQGFLWQNGTVTALALADGTRIKLSGEQSQNCLTESGKLIGWFEEIVNPLYGWTIGRAVVWDNGTATILGPTGFATDAVDINERGEVVGRYEESYEVFLWLPQAAYGLEAGFHLLVDESDWPVVNQISAIGISEAGQVYGWNSSGSYFIPDESLEDGGTWIDVPGILWVWQNGAFTELATLETGDASFFVNASGQLAGQTLQWLWDDDGNFLGALKQGYLWSEVDGLQSLETLGGTDITIRGISETGLALGGASLAENTESHACLWGEASEPEPDSALDISEVTLLARNPKVLTITVQIANPADVTAYDVTVMAATLDGVDTNSRLPLVYGAIKPGDSKKCTLQFKDAPSGDQVLTVSGTCSLGDFSFEQTVTVP